MKKIFGLFLIIGSWSLIAADLSFSNYFQTLENQNVNESNLINALSAYFKKRDDNVAVVFGDGENIIRVKKTSEGHLSFYYGCPKLYYSLKLFIDGSGQLVRNEVEKDPNEKKVVKRIKKHFDKKNQLKSIRREPNIPINTTFLTLNLLSPKYFLSSGIH